MNLSDPFGLWAGGVGGVVGGIIGTPQMAGGASGSCHLVHDGEGNWGLLCCLGFGGGVAAGAGASAQGGGIYCPTCNTICDMEGGFLQVEGFAAAGSGVGFSGGASINMNQISFSGSYGPAAGAGGGVAVVGGSCKLWAGGKKCKKCAQAK
jgi:hypothetical protein